MKNILKKLKGEFDYDFKQDILFFKTKNREYAKSIEFVNLVLDIDTSGLIVGIQIFEASKFLRIDKIKLRNIPQWEFNTKTDLVKENGKLVTQIEIRLAFQVKIRNKLIEKNPIIMPHLISEQLPISELTCTI